MSGGPGGSHQEEPEDEAWLLTYADMITLVMAFFVLMMGVSKVDYTAYAELSSALSEERTGNPDKIKEQTQTLQRDLKDIISNEGADQAVQARGALACWMAVRSHAGISAAKLSISPSTQSPVARWISSVVRFFMPWAHSASKTLPLGLVASWTFR